MLSGHRNLVISNSKIYGGHVADVSRGMQYVIYPWQRVAIRRRHSVEATVVNAEYPIRVGLRNKDCWGSPGSLTFLYDVFLKKSGHFLFEGGSFGGRQAIGWRISERTAASVKAVCDACRLRAMRAEKVLLGYEKIVDLSSFGVIQVDPFIWPKKYSPNGGYLHVGIQGLCVIHFLPKLVDCNVHDDISPGPGIEDVRSVTSVDV